MQRFAVQNNNPPVQENDSILQPLAAGKSTAKSASPALEKMSTVMSSISWIAV